MILHFDDQLRDGNDVSIRRSRQLFSNATAQVLEAYDISSFANHIIRQDATRIKLLVVDILVPQLTTDKTFDALGLGHIKVNVEYCGFQLLQILQGSSYKSHRKTWKNGVLSALENIPACLVSTIRQIDPSTFTFYEIPVNTKTFWKDAGSEWFETAFSKWVIDNQIELNSA